MNRKYKIVSTLGIATAILASLTACDKGTDSLKSDMVVKVGDKSYTEKTVKDLAEIDVMGRLSVSEGILQTALTKYYNDIDEKLVAKTVKEHVQSLEKSSKQKLSEEVKEEKEKSVRKNLQMNELLKDFIKLDNETIEKEFLAGYMVQQGLYTKAIGDDEEASYKSLQNFKKDVKKIKKSEDLLKVISKYSQDDHITVGSFTVTKDMSIFNNGKDTTITDKILKAEKGDLIVFNTDKDSDSKKDNYIYIADSWKANQSQVIQYKKAQYIKEHLVDTVAVLKALEEKHKDFKINKEFMKKLEDEGKGKYIIEKTKTPEEEATGVEAVPEEKPSEETAKKDSKEEDKKETTEEK